MENMFKPGDKQLISTHRPMGPFCGCIHILETVSGEVVAMKKGPLVV